MTDPARGAAQATSSPSPRQLAEVSSVGAEGLSWPLPAGSLSFSGARDGRPSVAVAGGRRAEWAGRWGSRVWEGVGSGRAPGNGTDAVQAYTLHNALRPHPYSLEVEGGGFPGVTWTGPERQSVPSL